MMSLRLLVPLFFLPFRVLALPPGNFDYSEADAIRFFHMAAAAYGDRHEDCVRRAFPAYEERRLHSNNTQECDVLGHSCAAFAVHSDAMREIIVVFRGTKTLTQLFTEGWQSLTPAVDFFGMGKVNRYFMTAHLSMWPPIEQYLNDPNYWGYSVVFTGHSLGGALAALAAARTVKQGFRAFYQVRVVTFGEPRVGSARFAFGYDALVPNTFRVVNGRDVVPHLPGCAKNTALQERNVAPCDPNTPDEPYQHGTEIWYPDGMPPSQSRRRYVICHGAPQNEDFACSDTLKFRFDDISDAVADHREYFGVKVSEHGKRGCITTPQELDEPPAIQRAIDSFNGFLKRIGIH